MKRALTVAAALTIALVVGAWRPLGKLTPDDGTVNSLSVVPASGRAEVLIGVGGNVSVNDFTLHDPERVVVDISGASLRLPRDGYDQVERGGVLGVRYSQYRQNVVRIVVSLDAPHHYSVSTDARQIRIAVDGTSPDFNAWHLGNQSAAATAASAPARAEPVPVRHASYSPAPQEQPRITVTWENANIKDVVAAFSAYSGRTIVLSSGVMSTTAITATITDQPWDVALRVVLNSNGLDAIEDSSGILIVDTQQHIQAQRAAEPLVNRSLRLNYVKAINLQPTIAARLSHDCSLRAGTGQTATAAAPPTESNAGGPPATTDLTCPVRGAVTSDTTTNTLSITDIASNVDSLVVFARSLDIRQPQVNIKAKIVSVDRTDLEALGLQYDIGSASQYFNDLVPRLDSTGTPQQGQGLIYLGGNTIAAVANASQAIPGSALKAVYSAAMGGFSFTSFIQALSTISLLDVQAEPSVTTLNNHQANLTAGTNVPIRVVDAGSQSGQSGPKATVQFQQVGIILTVTPQITANHQVQMTIHAENSDVQTFSNDVGAVFPKQAIDNTLLVADGQTAIMGGLTQTSVTVSKSGIPVLVDLPIIGKLFGFTSRQETKRDLLILITPHIVDDGQTLTGVGGSN